MHLPTIDRDFRAFWIINNYVFKEGGKKSGIIIQGNIDETRKRNTASTNSGPYLYSLCHIPNFLSYLANKFHLFSSGLFLFAIILYTDY